MLSDHIAQLHKARLYAAEPDRFKMLSSDTVLVTGCHHTHTISRNGHGWECSCAYFRATRAVYHTCAHCIALERILSSSSALPAEQETDDTRLAC